MGGKKITKRRIVGLSRQRRNRLNKLGVETAYLNTAIDGLLSPPYICTCNERLPRNKVMLIATKTSTTAATPFKVQNCHGFTRPSHHLTSRMMIAAIVTPRTIGPTITFTETHFS